MTLNNLRGNSLRSSDPEPASPHFRIAAARRMLYRAGLDSQIGGHVSLRVPGEDAFWVTPFQYFDETLPEHVSKVGFDLCVLEPGTLPASPGINFHASVMKARPDINCVIHTHAKSISILATTRKKFDVYYVYASMFADLVTEFVDDPSLTPDQEGTAIAAAMGHNKVALMPHHGSVHVGESLEFATVETIVFNLACEYQLAAMASGGEPMDATTARSYRDAYYKYGFREQMWLANLRRLRVSDPELFQDAASPSRQPKL
jgi:L-fuculose-phosphate aldolase